MGKVTKLYESILRKVGTEEKILKSTKRVESFKGSDVVELLKSLNMPESDAPAMVEELLQEGVLFKVVINKKNPKLCELSLNMKFNKGDTYIWSKERTSHTSLIICGVFILLAMCLVMFQMWPYKLRYLASYASYPLGAFILFLVVLGVIRLILFGITWFTHSPGIWLFPNLFADCGFFESFVPLWEYHGAATKQKEE